MKKVILLVASLLILSGCCQFSSAGCPPPDQVVCGDGYWHRTEGCDDGNEVGGDGCSAGCEVETGYKCHDLPSVCDLACGDDILDTGEQCDDGNNVDGDGCESNCQNGTAEELCMAEANAVRRDNCWYALAMTQPHNVYCQGTPPTQPSYCNQISTQGGKNLCFRDTEECCKIRGDLTMKNLCWDQLARSNEDEQLCDNILDQSMRQQCQLDLVSPGTFTVPNIGGQWSYSLRVVSAGGDCSGEVGATDSGTMSISQNGDQLTVTGFANGSLTGSFNGQTQAEVSGTYGEDGGRTSQTSTLTFADEVRPNSISISESWSWTGPGESCPGGLSTATATRLN